MSALHNDNLPAAASLKPFFYPRHVAVVGASRKPTGIGHRIIESLQQGGFAGSIVPVNPHATEIPGLQAFPSLRAIPGPVDLAVIAVPADVVLAVRVSSVDRLSRPAGSRSEGD